MVAIKDMKMPKSCMRCQVSDSVSDCPCKGNTLIFDYRDKRHPDCSLIEIEQSEDCVSRQAVIDTIIQWIKNRSIETFGSLKIKLDNLPPVISTRKQGKWMNTEDETCSVCGYIIEGDHDARFNYCPNCGAEMKGV